MAAPVIIAAALGAITTMAAGYEGAQGANQQAKESTKEGWGIALANEDSTRRANAQRLGQQHAQAAQSGFDPSSGSFLTLQQQSSQNAELDALTARYQGRLHQFTMSQETENANAKTRQGYAMAGGQLLSQGVANYGGDLADYASFLMSGSSYW
jgi:hypothetical protein